MTEFERVDYDVVPKENIHIPFLRNTLVNNGADWSTAPIPNVNYLPNYFNKWAKINMWNLNKPVAYNDKFSNGGISGLDIKGDSDEKLIYHRLPKGTREEPLRLGDYAGYEPKKQPPRVMPKALDIVIVTPDAVDIPQANIDIVNIGYLFKKLQEEQQGKHALDKVVTYDINGDIIKDVNIVGDTMPNIATIEAGKFQARVPNMTNRDAHEIHFANSHSGSESDLDSKYYFTEDGKTKFDLSFTHKVFFQGGWQTVEGIGIRGFGILSNMGSYNDMGILSKYIPNELIAMTWFNYTSNQTQVYIVLNRVLTQDEISKYTSLTIDGDATKDTLLEAYVCKDQRDDGYMLEILGKMIPKGRAFSNYWEKFDSTIPLGATEDIIAWAKGKPVLMLGGEFESSVVPNQEYKGVLFNVVNNKSKEK